MRNPQFYVSGERPMLGTSHQWGFRRHRYYSRSKMFWQNCATCTVIRANRMMPAWDSYPIGKIAGCACAGNAGNIFPAHRLQRKSLVSHSGMHHGTCVTHVPWCMSVSLTRSGGETIPGVCATPNFTYLVRGPLRYEGNPGYALIMGWHSMATNIYSAQQTSKIDGNVSMSWCKKDVTPVR